MRYLLTRLINGFEAGLSGFDDGLYAIFNGVAGWSWTLDTLIALPLENALAKAGVIGACFVFAWHQQGDEAAVARRRKILVVTIVASLLAIATTKTLSQTLFTPRPFVQSERAFYLEGDRLVESRPLRHRAPLDDGSRARAGGLERGEFIDNDLASFPSDHAGFFMTLAAGIFLASRRAGAIALGWTLIVILGSRIVTGQHSPLDILGGAAIGIVFLAALQLLARRISDRLAGPAARWTMRHSALSSALLFLVVFEATNTLRDVREIAGAGKTIAQGAIGI